MTTENTTQSFFISEEKSKLFTALAKFQGEVPNLIKDAKVTVKTKNSGTYNFDYVPLDSAIETVQPYLDKHGLAVLQPLIGRGKLLTIITHASGEYMQFELDFSDAMVTDEWVDNKKVKIPMSSAQDIGGIITYFRRYSFVSALRLAADKDDDANKALGNEVTERNTPKPSKPEPAKPAPKQPVKKESKHEPLPEPPQEELDIDDVVESGDSLSWEDELNLLTDRKEITAWFTRTRQSLPADQQKVFQDQMFKKVQEKLNQK